MNENEVKTAQNAQPAGEPEKREEIFRFLKR